MFTGYLGAFMLGAFYLAIGIFVSGLFKDQITAFLVTALACFFFFLVGQGFMAAIIDGWIGGFGSFLQESVSLSGHYDSIQRGVIDAGTVVYFGSMIVLFVVLNTLSLEGRRY